VLCKLINTIQPGSCPKYANNPKHWLEEKDNINKYLNACVSYGVPSQDLFSELDLSESRKDIIPVLQNIYALARQAQAHGYNGPRLGVKFYKTTEDIRKLPDKKSREKADEEVRRQEYDQDRAARREELEEENRVQTEREDQRAERHGNRRRRNRRRKGRRFVQFQENVLSPMSPRQDRDVPTAKFGMDGELHKKKMEHYDVALEDAILDWIEDMTGFFLIFDLLVKRWIFFLGVSKIWQTTVHTY